MGSSIELVSFLARSENRIEALLALESGPATRSELQRSTGIPRATLSRILADFRDRDLADRDGHDFSITPLGTLLAAELRSLSESIDVGVELQRLDPWLPLSEIGVDVRDLTDATVTLPSTVDPLAPVRRTAEVVAASERVRGLCNNVVPEILRTLRRAVVEDGLLVDVTVTADAFDAVTADPAVREVVRDLVGSGRVDIAVYDGGLPILAIDADGTVLLEVADDEGTIRGVVETEDEVIRSWFASSYWSYRRGAEHVVPELLTT